MSEQAYYDVLKGKYLPNPYRAEGCLATTHRFCAHADANFHGHSNGFPESYDFHWHTGGDKSHRYEEPTP